MQGVKIVKLKEQNVASEMSLPKVHILMQGEGWSLRNN